MVDDSSPIAGIYDAKTSHLTPAQTDFFKRWEALISLEEQDGVRFRKELWTMTAQEREEKGRCFDSMVIDKTFFPSNLPSAGKLHRYTYRFVRGNDASSQSQSLLNGHMSVGDAITVSVDPELLALARGLIVDLTPQQVVVGIDHELNVEKIAARLQVLRKFRGRIWPVFRIDRDENSGMGRIRDNLAQLFYADGDTKRLELVVDLRKPTFEDEQATVDALHGVPEYAAVTSTLNPGQVAAMTRVLSANDYALILGMPGTGKTTVIAALIRTFVATGKTVLLASYTHSAVDTILLKLMEDDYSILRLGNVDKVGSWYDIDEGDAQARTGDLGSPRRSQVYTSGKKDGENDRRTRESAHVATRRGHHVFDDRSVSLNRSTIRGLVLRSPQSSVFPADIRLLYHRRGIANNVTDVHRPVTLRRQVRARWRPLSTSTTGKLCS